MSGKLKSLKEFFKKPSNLLTISLLILVLTTSTLFFLELKRNSDRMDYFGQEVSRLTGSISEMEDSINQRLTRIGSAELLLNNTNRILSTVYFGTADIGERKEAKDFTAFSMIHDDKFYIITAGHCVEMDGEKYSNFKFKANKGKNWITPVLLDYKSDYINNLDYAIFYSDRLVSTGLIAAKPGEDMKPQYVLGNLERGLNLVKKYSEAKEGESGSPVLNSSCHVIGLMIKKGGTYTPIGVVLEALMALK